MTWTQEQIDEAAKRVAQIIYPPPAWESLYETGKEHCRAIVLAAQMPIAEVTDTEFAFADADGNKYGLRECLNRFIARRNARPKPDLRERIAGTLEAWMNTSSVVTSKEVADRILAIVKEQQ